MKFLITITMLLPSIASACLWLSGTTLEGNHVNLEIHNKAQQLERALEGSPEEKIRNLIRLNAYKRSQNYIDAEILALEALADADYKKAISILKNAAEKSPNSYSIAANLGTAYELDGNLEQALHWIKESIRMNSDSHYGTEWLHVAILEAKIGIQQSKGYKDFLSIPERFDDSTKFSIADKSYTVDEISDALFYQLNERMVFVKPEEPIVADLLFDFALILANTATLETAVSVLKLSDQYGYPSKAEINRLIDEYEKVILIRKAKPYIWGSLSLFCLIAVLVYAYQRKWFFISSVDYKKHKAANSVS
ncbi:MAG: tetratricopeptide repeat protein [Opitutaceae bacterium]